MGRFRKFRELSWEEQLLFAEGYFLHLTTGLILKVIPFRWIPRLFSSPQFEAPTQEETQTRLRRESERQSGDIELIRTALHRAGRISPWKNKCLVSSLAARCMLRRRRINSILSLGVTKDNVGRLIAHAWIRSGYFEVVEKSGEYTELYTF